MKRTMGKQVKRREGQPGDGLGSGSRPSSMNDTCLLMVHTSLHYVISSPVTRPGQIRHARQDRPIGAIAGARTPACEHLWCGHMGWLFRG